MKSSEIQNLKEEEIESKISDAKNQLRKHRFAHSISPIENPMLIRHERRNIARLKTILNQKNKNNNKEEKTEAQ